MHFIHFQTVVQYAKVIKCRYVDVEKMPQKLKNEPTTQVRVEFLIPLSDKEKE